MRIFNLIFVAVTALLISSCIGSGSERVAPHRGVYHWKTVYNPTAWELEWIKDHKVDKLYIKLFDVDAGVNAGRGDWLMVPTATIQFRQKPPSDAEIVPVVYLTSDAIRALNDAYGSEEEYAALIVKRIEDIVAENLGGAVKINEVQLDCDWTQQTEAVYFRLVREVRRLLHERGKTLSGTLRLHQLHEVEQPTQYDFYDGVHYDSIPFDRCLLMCYNTGRLQERSTRNSILDFDDVKPYLRQYRRDSLPRTDVAYPVYGWGVEFDGNGRFKQLVHTSSLPQNADNNIREEWGETREIPRTKSALPKLDADHTVILYHLDSINLSKYSHNDIEAFYSR